MTRELHCDIMTIIKQITMHMNISEMEIKIMERIKTLETRDLCESAKKGGCGECQTSCQSACKTSCGVANQSCESK